jgi:SAM-dependent methyltransferase
VSSDHVEYNRAFWDGDSDEYQDAHGDALDRAPLAWGAYRIPESELQILGDAVDRDVLEVGCGAAQWSIALAALGARVIGLDVSQRQLEHARRRDAQVPVVLANGEQLPFADDVFDTVFCDHGALSFCEPAVILAEVRRTLRPDGRLAFCGTHPLLYLTYDLAAKRQSKKLQMEYAALGKMDLGEGTIDWALPPSEWISLLRSAGFSIERLVELRPPASVTTTYEDFAPPKWARRWPAEWIWVARRESS